MENAFTSIGAISSPMYIDSAEVSRVPKTKCFGLCHLEQRCRLALSYAMK
jgi:hypothetical protein